MCTRSKNKPPAPGGDESRACKACGVVQPADRFYWKSLGVRRDSLCIPCRKEYQARRYDPNRHARGPVDPAGCIRTVTGAEWALRERRLLAAHARLEARGEYPGPVACALESGLSLKVASCTRVRLLGRDAWPATDLVPSRAATGVDEEEIPDLAERIAREQARWSESRWRNRAGLRRVEVPEVRVRMLKGAARD